MNIFTVILIVLSTFSIFGFSNSVPYNGEDGWTISKQNQNTRSNIISPNVRDRRASNDNSTLVQDPEKKSDSGNENERVANLFDSNNEKLSTEAEPIEEINLRYANGGFDGNVGFKMFSPSIIDDSGYLLSSQGTNDLKISSRSDIGRTIPSQAAFNNNASPSQADLINKAMQSQAAVNNKAMPSQAVVDNYGRSSQATVNNKALPSQAALNSKNIKPSLAQAGPKNLPVSPHSAFFNYGFTSQAALNSKTFSSDVTSNNKRNPLKICLSFTGPFEAVHKCFAIFSQSNEVNGAQQQPYNGSPGMPQGAYGGYPGSPQSGYIDPSQGGNIGYPASFQAGYNGYPSPSQAGYNNYPNIPQNGYGGQSQAGYDGYLNSLQGGYNSVAGQNQAFNSYSKTNPPNNGQASTKNKN